MFKLNPVLLALIAAQGMMFPVLNALAEIINPYTPENNDYKAGALYLRDGSVRTLTGLPQFTPGVSGVTRTTLGELQRAGRIVTDTLTGQPRINVGQQNLNIVIPEPANNSYKSFHVYDSLALTDLPGINTETQVEDFYAVNDRQYIDARVASVTRGTLNINIGRPDRNAGSATNRWSMAARQSQLFTTAQRGHLNWNSNNRIIFTAVEAPPANNQLTLSRDSVVNYTGTFTVNTRDGGVTTFTVTSLAELRNYNDWLINQLLNDNITQEEYGNAFNKAFSLNEGRVVYRTGAGNRRDEVRLPAGDRIVLSANGRDASVKISAGCTLEVINASTAMQASNGATAIIDGKLAVTATGIAESRALALLSGSTGINNGTLNAGFLNNASGTGVDRSTLGYIGKAVAVKNGSRFTNNGVINLAPGNGSESRESSAIWIAQGSAVNRGSINVGVTDVVNNSSAAGVTLGAAGHFINTAQGTIAIGRSPQNRKTDRTQDVAVTLSGGVSAIEQRHNSSAINNGRIVIGSHVQNAAGMRVENAPYALTLNNGVIDINGRAQPQPLENIGMLVLNAGQYGRVGNAGTINVNGDNSTGLRILATKNHSASAWSAGTINVKGDADLPGGTHNTAVRVTGEQGGQARAMLRGRINLQGDAAIGVRADGNARVDIAASAVPRAGEGRNQISFLIQGPDARIRLPASGRYATSSPNGTLFRLADGADFNASGTTLSLNAPGATGIVGSGRGSDIVTRNAVFNAGAYASAVRIEGGAQGTLNAETRLRLTGKGASAATVDGYKYDLSGRIISADFLPDSRTLLNSHAAIRGLADGQSGLVALNQAQLINTGHITSGGEGSVGILARFGAKVVNRGDISVLRGATGLYAGGFATPEESTATTEITTRGALNVYGGSGNRQTTLGAVASGEQAVLNQNGIINLYGANVVGARAEKNAIINSGATSRVVFHHDNQIGYQATDVDSIIFSSGGSTDVSTAGSTLYQVSNGGDVYAREPGTITLSGANTTGVSVSGSTSYAYRTDRYNVNGRGAAALRVYERGEGIVTSPIALNGNNTSGVITAGDQATAYAASDITGRGRQITAFDAGYYSAIFNQYQGVVNLTGPESTGARVHDNASFLNFGSVRIASGTGIDASSGYGYYYPRESSRLQVDDGIAALRVGNSGGLAVQGDGQGYSTITASGRADGVLLDNGAQWFQVSDITLGAYGRGSVINNRAGLTAISLQNVRLETGRGTGIRSAVSFDGEGYAQIIVGEGGTGYLFANEDGSATRNDLFIGQGYSITVPGKGTSIRANTTGDVVTAGSIAIESANGGSAVVTRTARRVINQGNITSQSLVAPIIDLRGGASVFINEGTVTAPNPHTVVVAGGASRDVVALLGGRVTGDVHTGNGEDTLIVTGGTLKGSLTMGSGANNRATVQNISLQDTRHITTAGGAGSTLNLHDLTARGGSFASDDPKKGTNIGAGWSTLNFSGTRWTLTDNLRLAHSTINIDADSTLQAGNGIQPLLQGGSATSLQVNNAGTLDLTNGSSQAGNSLTINGDLTSVNGTLRLNSAATRSDILRVNGNVSGTTLIDDELRGAPLMDRNRDGIIGATEGVSLAQVSGRAAPQSFALKQGYVASGPWQYRLYSFAPGSSAASQRQLSGSGDDFSDYRLANAFVCADGVLCQPQSGNGKTGLRRAVTPQIPSYISAPVGLAWYTLAITDDLHKRLGELRQQHDPDAADGEMFVRYLGANMHYQSSRGLSNYGYDADLDYSAVQFGGNLIRLDGADDSLRGGIAWTRGNTRIRPHAVDGYSSTAFDSDSVALYGTWQHNIGLYVDSSLSWNRYRGETDIMRQKAVASPEGSGWAASLESGYAIELTQGWRIEPQAQLTWQRLDMDSLTDRDQTRVSWDRYQQTVGRLGARLDRTWQDESLRQYTPYLRVNYYHGWGGTAKTRAGTADGTDSQRFDSGKFGQMWNVGLGGTATLTRDVSLYAETDYRKEIDGNGVRGWHYNAGVRWSF